MKQKVDRHAGRKARLRAKIIRWTGVVAVIGLLVYGASQMSNIAFDEEDIKVVNFADMDRDQKRTALEAANAQRCPCGCGMTLAQCVSTDMTCPIREGNIEKIKTIVRDARAASGS